ncbi:hypothetical protein KBT16_24995 [Nostoc sp. CCCryo 231-06]|nr:hypothetical protein [Nostoc sp. CCCryo 231-06]
MRGFEFRRFPIREEGWNLGFALIFPDDLNCQIVNHCHRIWSLTRAKALDKLDFVGEVAAAWPVATARRNPNQKPLSPN